MFAAGLIVVALCLVPVTYLAVDTFSLGWSDAYDLLVRPRVATLLWNTTLLTVVGVLASAVVGTALAWVVTRTDLPGRRLWNVLFVAPLAIPAFVTSFGWVSVLPGIASPQGAFLVVTLAYYPLVYLPVAAALRGMDPTLEESAQVLGLGSVQCFRRVVLPQLRPALLGGGLLVGLHLLSEFGAIQLLRYDTFTTAIYEQYESSYGGPAASTLAAVLVVLCAVLLLSELRLQGARRYSRVGTGAARRLTTLRLGTARLPVLLGSAALVVLALGVPAYSMVRWLVLGGTTRFPAADLAGTAATTAGLGAVAAVLTMVVALPVALLAVRHRGRFASVVERATFVSTSLPGIVVALALVSFSLAAFPAVYQTTTLLLGAYVLLFLPRAVVGLRTALAQAPPLLDDVASSLGLRRMSTIVRVTLPLIARGVGAGAALVFLAVVTELTATLLLSPIGTTTLATEFWAQSSQVQYGAAAPYAVLMVIISAPATLFLTRDVRRAAVL